ncbi:50S ribosomal protein L7/L12 [Candidatus Absconditicoccus praedator]|uniref:50S ribosomal protein L7/L12 n=1 Tax=Candidatus Absconditicoccus praedator TaxID=2735562 RepID=UPI001E6116FB|nr:50S ribosomal protein L7/L12 [Candidatus Absconditicoccus praedator]UFX82537.1 50S ribosomal protein L7/L12 [Candidatus Absconditicoccus praedator]
MELSKNAQQIMDLLKELSVTELNDLVKALEEEFGVSAAPVAVAGGGGASDEEGGGSDTVTVEIAEIGQQKITVIKTLKEALGLGLKEAKELVEKVPGPVKENVSPDEGEELKAKLEEAGATVTLK